MSLRINTNTQALNALRNLGSTVDKISMSIGKLSTGLRINTAGDDPAGLIISENMRSQIAGIDAAVRNSQDAINMTKTAEAAMGEVQELLRNIRGLAVNSANTAVVDAATLQANQSQIRSTLQSVNRIASSTSWGAKRLLDGSAGSVATVTDPTDVASIYMSGTFNGLPIANGAVGLRRLTAPAKATVTLGQQFTTTGDLVPAGTFVVNGYSFSTNGSETLTTVVAKFNEMSGTTGATATIADNGSGKYVVNLKSNSYGAQFPLNFFDSASALHTSTSATANGTDGSYLVQATTTTGTASVTFTGGKGPKESGLVLTDNEGNKVMLNEAAITNIGAGGFTSVGQVTAGSVRFQIGGNSGQSVAYSMPTIFPNNLGKGIVAGKALADIDITTQQGADDAMKIIDEAVNQLAQWRGDLGGFQSNFLNSTVRSLGISKENLQASESAIRDADMAQEMTEYTRLQILQQSGMSMLAQANQAPQQVLQLLKG